MPFGVVPTLTALLAVDGNAVPLNVAATGMYSIFEVIPLEDGLTTVIEPRPTAATNASGTVAVNCLELTKVVVRAVPFQCTTEAGMKLAPRKVMVTPVLPGVMLTGEAISIKGTGFGAAGVLTASIAFRKSGRRATAEIRITR
jgi:hypothetical protein